MAEYEKRGYLLDNFRLFHLKTTKDTAIGLHYHAFCKLLFLVSGEGSYHIGGQHYSLCPGDIVLVGSHSVHRPEMDPGIPYERIILYVSPEYLQQLSTGGSDLLSLFSGEPGPVFRPQEPQRELLFSLAAALERDLSQEGFGRDLLGTASLIRLLVELGRCRENRNLPDTASPRNQRIGEILRYLNRHLTEPVDIDTLSETFFISKYYMMRAFRQETGTTIHAYLTQRRLALAKEMLDAGMSATDTCYHCGFRSYSAFTRAYGKRYGVSPTGRAGASPIRAEDYE